MTCNNLDFSRVGPDFAASGCLYNASFDRFFIRKRCDGGSRGVKNGYGARKLFCFKQDIGNTEASIKGVAPIPVPVAEVKIGSRSPISLVNLFELVADDLLTLNNNLHSVSSTL